MVKLQSTKAWGCTVPGQHKNWRTEPGQNADDAVVQLLLALRRKNGTARPDQTAVQGQVVAPVTFSTTGLPVALMVMVLCCVPTIGSERHRVKLAEVAP